MDEKSDDIVSKTQQLEKYIDDIIFCKIRKS